MRQKVQKTKMAKQKLLKPQLKQYLSFIKETLKYLLKSLKQVYYQKALMIMIMLSQIQKLSVTIIKKHLQIFQIIFQKN
jgi:hypothetical protein